MDDLNEQRAFNAELVKKNRLLEVRIAELESVIRDMLDAKRFNIFEAVFQRATKLLNERGKT